MYSWELEHYIKDRNGCIGGDDLLFIIDVKNHPQINYIEYRNGRYTITTNDGYVFNFAAMSCTDAEKNGLFKSLIKKRPY